MNDPHHSTPSQFNVAHGETLSEMLSRWKRISLELYTASTNKFDVSKVSTTYDYAKYDSVHNRQLSVATFILLRHILHTSSWLACLILDCEYGINPSAKFRIGKLVSQPLLRFIVEQCIMPLTSPTKSNIDDDSDTDDDLDQMPNYSPMHCFFTSESHIATLTNFLFNAPNAPPSRVLVRGELNYLSNICFKVYRSVEGRIYLKVLLSTGVDHDVFGSLGQSDDVFLPIRSPVVIYPDLSLEYLFSLVKED
eukprot:CAMPEP_0201546708 /NCGR_PEP_ID=MMETSP0173_2-20130828/3032_1 /ASSEMBLY_ACC=CAM_ASM_000268 /TAXON_ID=218659 /ORGANISM="Vexillifera sp., Strain DIVA3 564/2" /LENGTH=250 /DNA_ID=CAMNT_0047955461 /DNA_START=269 /DNA_END=1021 /DNA_ORIENTATION=-